jgi:hypothetical protein
MAEQSSENKEKESLKKKNRFLKFGVLRRRAHLRGFPLFAGSENLCFPPAGID